MEKVAKMLRVARYETHPNFLRLIHGTGPYLLWEGGRTEVLRCLGAMRFCKVEAINRIGFLNMKLS
jgi:hypothetical protein